MVNGIGLNPLYSLSGMYRIYNPLIVRKGLMLTDPLSRGKLRFRRWSLPFLTLPKEGLLLVNRSLKIGRRASFTTRRYVAYRLQFSP